MTFQPLFLDQKRLVLCLAKFYELTYFASVVWLGQQAQTKFDWAGQQNYEQVDQGSPWQLVILPLIVWPKPMKFCPLLLKFIPRRGVSQYGSSSADRIGGDRDISNRALSNLSLSKDPKVPCYSGYQCAFIWKELLDLMTLTILEQMTWIYQLLSFSTLGLRAQVATLKIQSQHEQVE